MDAEELAAANIWNMPRVAAMYPQAEAVAGSEHGRHILVKGVMQANEREVKTIQSPAAPFGEK